MIFHVNTILAWVHANQAAHNPGETEAYPVHDENSLSLKKN